MVVDVLGTCLDGEGRAGQAAYAASKAALAAFSDCLRAELRAAGSRVCLLRVAPRRTATALRAACYPGEAPELLLDPREVGRAVAEAVAAGARLGPLASGSTVYLR